MAGLGIVEVRTLRCTPSHQDSWTLIYTHLLHVLNQIPILLWKDFAVAIKAPDQLTLR